jgi:hypothetical protein
VTFQSDTDMECTRYVRTSALSNIKMSASFPDELEAGGWVAMSEGELEEHFSRLSTADLEALRDGLLIELSRIAIPPTKTNTTSWTVGASRRRPSKSNSPGARRRRSKSKTRP